MYYNTKDTTLTSVSFIHFTYLHKEILKMLAMKNITTTDEQ